MDPRPEPNYHPLERVPMPTSFEELSNIAVRDMPVVFAGSFFGPSVASWGVPTLLKSTANALFDVRITTPEEDDPGFAGPGLLVRMTLEDLLQAWSENSSSSSSGEQNKTRHYLSGSDIRYVESLMSNVNLIVPPELVTEVGLWVGRNEQHSQCHFDAGHNVLHMIDGAKDVILASPKAFFHMYTYSYCKLCGFICCNCDYQLLFFLRHFIACVKVEQ
jgi:hypothetical protein